jgi:hypothetical protein
MKNLSSCKPGMSRSKGARAVLFNQFSVPNESSANGAVTGTRLFREILDNMKADTTPQSRINLHPMSLIGEIGRALDEKPGNSRHGAASAIAWLLDDCVSFFARHSNFEDYLERKLEEAMAYADYEAKRKVMDGADFAKRMTAAKARKRRASVSSVAPDDAGVPIAPADDLRYEDSGSTESLLNSARLTDTRTATPS